MSGKLPIFYRAMMLTLVNLLLRAVGTSFQIYLSRRIGAAGVGLLQLTMSVGSLALVAGIAGVRTASMYLCAEELGKHRSDRVTWVLSGCFGYSIACSCTVAAALYCFAPQIASHWIGTPDTCSALRLLAAFLPLTCLCGCMTGYFTAAGRIGTLAAVEVGEQICSMAVTMSLLMFYAGDDPGRACQCVILGSGISCAMALIILVVLRVRENPPCSAPIPVAGRLCTAAIPLGLADILRSGIGTTENLMVPRRLGLHPNTLQPLAAFGIVSGMVFPVMMFPACILFALAELLIPELARCNAAGSRHRIRYLVRRGQQIALIYGCFFAGLLYLLSDPLCYLLYHRADVGGQLRLYALLVPMLYCDAITDAMTKGLGQQRVCVMYNIITSILDVIGLYILLPQYGMTGYFISFAVTHGLNFLLSIGRLRKITGVRGRAHQPLFTIAGLLLAVSLAGIPDQPLLQAITYPALLGSIWFLFGVLSRGSFRWIRNLLKPAPDPHCREVFPI